MTSLRGCIRCGGPLRTMDDYCSACRHHDGRRAAAWQPVPVVHLDWHAQAACAGHPDAPQLWFPERGESTREAKAVCAKCPVASACLEFALATPERHGVWGGLSERGRRQVRRRRFRRRQAAARAMRVLAELRDGAA